MNYLKKLAKRTMLVALSAIVILMFLEIGAWGISRIAFGAQEGDYKKIYQKSKADLDLKSTPRFKAHPFFGYVSSSSNPERTNGLGFISNYEYPYKKSPGDFVIGIFGGSVAKGLPMFTEGKIKMVQFLQSQVPQLKNRKIIFLNFALGGMKQPQQYAIYSHFVDTIDLSVNLDGYNEISFNAPGLPVENPSWYEVLFNSDLNQYEKLRKLKQIRDLQNKVTEWPLEYSLLAKSNLYYLVWFISTKKINRFSSEISSELLLGNLTNKEKLKLDDDWSRMQAGANNWGRFTNLQATLAKALHKPALFLIQPSPRVIDTKILSTEETQMLANIVDKEQRLKLTSQSYKILRKELSFLSRVTPNAVDLSYIFENHSETVYTDDCCHLNKEGNELLGREIISLIAKTLNSNYK